MASRRKPLITLLTDFGLQDSYAAEMKGVILSALPEAQLQDISHDIPPFAVEKAAKILRQISKVFPPKTIHVAVVDPGVGGPRKPLLVKVAEQYFIGPDNGLFSLVWETSFEKSAWEIITASVKISPTFHGRDVFAPAAIALALGRPLPAIGKPLADIKRLLLPKPVKISSKRWEGNIVSFDRFGNAATNLPGKIIGTMARPQAWVAGRKITSFPRTFCLAQPRQPGIIVNSEGFLEIMLPCASAQKRLRLRLGEKILLISA